MYIDHPNYFFEMLARFRYVMQRNSRKREPAEYVEYRDRRWYRLDSNSRVIKVARTYFEVMQPKQ